MTRFKLDVGRAHGVKPGNIVGAIANEGKIDSQHIGAIEIYDNYSTVDLPDGMPDSTKQTLQKTRVSGQRINLREWSDQPPKRSK
jgi:ATP-dependent RNA helicase DeaD